MDARYKAQWYITSRFAFSRLCDKLGIRGHDCDQKLFGSWAWDCCELHRALKSVNDAIENLGDELNDAYSLGGISYAYFEALVAGEDVSRFRHDPQAPHVGSQTWILQLSNASGVPLPQEKPSWWLA